MKIKDCVTPSMSKNLTLGSLKNVVYQPNPFRRCSHPLRCVRWPWSTALSFLLCAPILRLMVYQMISISLTIQHVHLAVQLWSWQRWPALHPMRESHRAVLAFGMTNKKAHGSESTILCTPIAKPKWPFRLVTQVAKAQPCWHGMELINLCQPTTGLCLHHLPFHI